MLFQSDSPFELALIIYVVIVFLIIITKPDILFNNPSINSKFGINNGDKIHRKTIIPLWLIFVLLAVTVYYGTIIAYG